MSKTNLKEYFPLLRTREEIMSDICSNSKLMEMYSARDPEDWEEFLDFCTGAKGVKMLYDSFFKEVFNPEYAPERLSDFLSVILNQKVKILQILPNDTIRIADENLLLITDTGVEVDMLQEFYFICLDIFREKLHNDGVTDKRDAWLTFLCEDDPEYIIMLLDKYSEFKALYEDVYRLCLNMEDIMGIFSEELRMLDRNTVQFMMDEMQKDIDKKKLIIEEMDEQIAERDEQIAERDEQIAELKKQLESLSDIKG